MGSWIASAVRTYCPNAELCLAPFHIVKLATDALDEVRREVWNAARRAGDDVTARELKRGALGAVKEPREAPRPSGAEPLLHPGGQRAAPQGLPAQGAAATGLPSSHPCRSLPARSMDYLGTALPPAGLRQGGRHRPRSSRRHRRHPRASPLQRPGRGHEHPHPADYPQCVRFPLRRRPRRPGTAQLRRPLPASPSTTAVVTHGNVTRATFC
jgi:hypothetical protein